MRLLGIHLDATEGARQVEGHVTSMDRRSPAVWATLPGEAGYDRPSALISSSDREAA